MSLITGTPLGEVNSYAEIFLDTPPTVWYQDNLVQQQEYLNNPDSDGFYWGLTGSSANPVIPIGCYEDFSFADNITMNDIRCDTVGVVQTIQKRDYVDITFTAKSLIPLTRLADMLKWGPVTTNAGEGTEKVGIGQPNNAQYWYVYFASVYDQDTGDYVNVTVHRAQFIDSTEIAFPYGNAANVAITIRGFADTTKPADQQFATIIRADPSEIP